MNLDFIERQTPRSTDPPVRFERTLFGGCPLCACKQYDIAKVARCDKHELYRADFPPEMHWLQCLKCHHIYVDGFFEPDALAVLFSTTKPTQTPGHDVEGGRMVAAEMVERVLSASDVSPIMPRRWLDVGFGAGHLLTTAAEYGFDVTGIDTREEPVRILASLGYDVARADFGTFRDFDAFDVISMADVLEHMPFPDSALNKAHALLRDGGTLFVSMPNADSFAWRALDIAGTNPYWGEVEHLHNFGRERLYRLLRAHGFEPVSYGVSRRYRVCMEVIARKLH